MRHGRLVVLVLLAGCWDFGKAVETCKSNPSLCLSGAGGGAVGTGEAATANGCSDGVDNDHDGKTDCEDSDCDGQTCRPAAGDCDVAEVCANGACPADSLAPATKECRASQDQCDLAEHCTGSAAECPADSFVDAGVPCGPAPRACELPAQCSGQSRSCPNNAIKGMGVLCRPDAGPCDVAEFCTGASPDCPADAFQPSSSLCRPAVAGGCDLDDFCSGDAGACPADAVQPAMTVCRAPAGACDTPEVCDGLSALCPADSSKCDGGLYCNMATNSCTPQSDAGTGCATDVECLSGHCVDSVCCATACSSPCAGCNEPGHAGQCSPKPAGTVCRPDAGACDVPESCTGGSLLCPTDAFLPSTTLCRPAAGICDVPESCTGMAAACPNDSFKDTSVICRPDAGPCDIAETCNGTAPGCPSDQLLGPTVVCRPKSANVCDSPESCTGMSNQCPPDGLLAAGSPCGTVSCPVNQILPAPACDDGGSCVPGSPVSCNGYVCNSAAATCFASCTPAAGCDTGHFCDGGVCQAKPGIGSPCMTQGDCSVGFCTDGVCCDQQCNGGCQFCSAAGTCTARAPGTDVEGACGAYNCDGLGACHTDCVSQPSCSNYCKSNNYCTGGGSGTCVADKSPSNACGASCECASGNCTDGFCCNSPCTGVCQSCATTPGTCTSYAKDTDPESGCGNTTCDGMGACLVSCSGGLCTADCKSTAYCSGTTCAGDLTAGLPCSASCQCAGGLACTAYYPDADGDHFGAGAATYFCGTGTVTGYALNNTDCCDTDGTAYPGQSGWFATTRIGCGGYDYNCLNGDEPEYPSSSGCTTEGDCTSGFESCDGDGTTGWLAAPPGCSASATWVTSCTSVAVCAPATCPGCTRCNSTTTSRQQKCH